MKAIKKTNDRESIEHERQEKAKEKYEKEKRELQKAQKKSTSQEKMSKRKKKDSETTLDPKLLSSDKSMQCEIVLLKDLLLHSIFLKKQKCKQLEQK